MVIYLPSSCRSVTNELHDQIIVLVSRAGHGGAVMAACFFFLVKTMDSVWIPTFVSQAMAAVVDSVLSYEIPRWCTAIYVKATFPNTKAIGKLGVTFVASNFGQWFFGVKISGIGYTEILSPRRMCPRLN
jgi:hypothetical protein